MSLERKDGESPEIIIPHEVLSILEVSKNMQELFNIEYYNSYIEQKIGKTGLSERDREFVNRFINIFRSELSELLEYIEGLLNAPIINSSMIKGINRKVDTIMNIIEMSKSAIQLMQEKERQEKELCIFKTFGQISLDKQEEIANTDHLTGLPNSRSFHNNFRKILNSPQKTEYHLAYFDLVDFKKVNDNYSHKVGDLVLKMLADIIKEYNAYRLGGDEFVMIFGPDEEVLDIAKTIQEKFLQRIGEYNTSHIPENKKKIQTGIRFGITPIFDEDENPDDIQLRADDVSYVTKILYEKNPNNSDYTKQGIVFISKDEKDYCTYINNMGSLHVSYKISNISQEKEILPGRETDADDEGNIERILFHLRKEIARENGILSSKVIMELISEHMG